MDAECLVAANAYLDEADKLWELLVCAGTVEEYRRIATEHASCTLLGLELLHRAHRPGVGAFGVGVATA